MKDKTFLAWCLTCSWYLRKNDSHYCSGKEMEAQRGRNGWSKVPALGCVAGADTPWCGCVVGRNRRRGGGDMYIGDVQAWVASLGEWANTASLGISRQDLTYLFEIKCLLIQWIWAGSFQGNFIQIRRWYVFCILNKSLVSCSPSGAVFLWDKLLRNDENDL